MTDTYEIRRVGFHPVDYGNGYVCEVFIETIEEHDTHKQPIGRKKVGQYAFAPIRDELADTIRGDIDVEKPVMYIGNTVSKHYYTSKDHSDVPRDVFEELRERGMTLVTNVDGGWVSWEGRPEWSDTYLDVTEAERVDIEKIIEERKEDNE